MILFYKYTLLRDTLYIISNCLLRLPTLDPICVGENAHNDWIFDQTWLDDQFLVSGSRDGSLALWRVTEEMVEQVTSADIPTYQYIK